MRSFAIVPAAGHSRRMGRPKLLLPWRGKTVVEHLLSAWHAGGVTRVVVVARRDDTALHEVCRAWPVDLVTPEVDPPDMKASVAHALSHIAACYAPQSSDVWLLAPADQPQLSPTVIRQLLAMHDPTNAVILAPIHEGRRGHPVLFPWPLAIEVQSLAADQGINQLLHRFAVREVACEDPSISVDLDTPDDYRRLTGDA